MNFATPPRPRALLVEDDEAVRRLVGLALREAGLALTLAADGQAAVEFYRRQGQEVVAVLLGVQPHAGLDGPWTLVALKGNHEDMMLAYLGLPGHYGESFLFNGGFATLQSYEIDEKHIVGETGNDEITSRLPGRTWEN